MGKLKYSLISLLAVCLTAGGVFGAYVFSNNTIYNPEDFSVEGNPNLLPVDRYEFSEVQISFNAGQGKFLNGDTYVTMNSPKSQSIDLDEYNRIFNNFDSYPVVKDQNGNITAYFSHWVDANKINDDGYHFDEAINEDTTFVAVYVPKNNPVLCKKIGDNIEKLHYFTINTETSFTGGDEFKISNFIVSEVDRNGWGNQSTVNRSFQYVVLFDDDGDGEPTTYSTLNAMSDGELGTMPQKDYIYNGLYTVFFRDIVNDDVSWQIYGGNTFFQRDYNYEIVGTPAGNWDVSSPNAPKFGYVNTDNNGIKTYKITKAYFPKQITMDDGTLDASREFKIASPYFAGSYGLCNISKENTYKHTYKYTGDTSTYYLNNTKPDTDDTSANLVIRSDCDYEYFDITIKVSYESIQDYYFDPDLGCNIYAFGSIPDEIEIIMEPYKYQIHYYNKAGTEIEYTEYVKYGGVSNEYNKFVPENDDPYDFPSKGWEVETWLDRDTNEPISFSGLSINKNYFVKPVFALSEEELPTKNLIIKQPTSESAITTHTIPIYQGYNVQRSLDYYEEKGTYVNERAIFDLTTSDYLTVNTNKFYFDNFALNTLEATSYSYASNIKTSEINNDTTYYVRYAAKNVLYYYASNNSTHTYKYSSLYETNIYSNMIYTGYKILGLNVGLDRIESNIKGHNLNCPDGKYYITKNTSNWTILRVVKVNYKDNQDWNSGNNEIFVKYGDSSMKNWLNYTDWSGTIRTYRINYDAHFEVVTSWGGWDDSKIWKRTGDIALNNHNGSFSVSTPILYIWGQDQSNGNRNYGWGS